jgi:caffeoyl-CoA O-methyltransferase
MELFDEDLIRYIEAHSESESPLLAKINRETHLQVLKARMLSGHLQGRVLSMFSHMIKPVNILEIGTFTGYSALCLAEGMKPEGKLITIDKNEELKERVMHYFSESAYSNQLALHIGNALEIIPSLDVSFDIVFIDADKENYLAYYDMVFDKVNKGGYIIADNVLWYGKVIEKYRNKLDKDTEALMAFNQKVHEDARVQHVLFPVRDGLMVARKL